MGIPFDIFSLYRLHSGRDNGMRHLLLRVGQPEFSNADQTSHDRAVDIAEAKQRELIEIFKREMLDEEDSGLVTATLIGELQSSPVGDELLAEHGRCHVDLWIAETRYGSPWVVMGTAESEDIFWREVEENEDLRSLGPIRPASHLQAFFMTENDRIERGSR
jgi:hypothetical protein